MPNPPEPLILPFNGVYPKIDPSAWLAPNATIIGDVTIGPDASVYYGCVLRGDIAPITIGARTNVQDGTVFHLDADAPCTVGDDVTIGHMALVHGSHVGNGALIGMRSVLLSHSVVGEGALVAAGAVVLEHQEIPARSLAAGVPAKVRRELTDAQVAEFLHSAEHYVENSRAQRESVEQHFG